MGIYTEPCGIVNPERNGVALVTHLLPMRGDGAAAGNA